MEPNVVKNKDKRNDKCSIMLQTRAYLGYLGDLFPL